MVNLDEILAEMIAEYGAINITKARDIANSLIEGDLIDMVELHDRWMDGTIG